MDEATAAQLTEAFRYWTRPAVVRAVRFPPADHRRAQLEAVGWLSVFLGAADLGLRLLDLARSAPDVMWPHTRAAVAGLLAGDAAPAAELDRIVANRTQHSWPPHDLGSAAREHELSRLARGSSPQDALYTSAVLRHALQGGYAATLGIEVDAVRDLAERQLAAEAEPLLADWDVDPDGDGVTIATVLAGIGRVRRPSVFARHRMERWTYADHQGFPQVDVARSWGWVMRTTDGLDGDVGHGITRLLPIGEVRHTGYPDHNPQWPGEVSTDLGDSAVVGEGPGRLLVLPRFVTPVETPFVRDCAAWVIDASTGTVLNRAPTLWQFLRDR